MKVLLINGSPNEKGCTYTALSKVAESLNEENIETEIIYLGAKPLADCIGCKTCFKEEHKEKGNGFGYCLFNQNSQYTNTLSARYYKDGSEILIDQSTLGKNPRKLTQRECARLQGFPENFIVDAVSQGQMYKQFGNSVCVKVIEALANQLVNCYKQAEKIKS